MVRVVGGMVVTDCVRRKPIFWVRQKVDLLSAAESRSFEAAYVLRVMEAGTASFSAAESRSFECGRKSSNISDHISILEQKKKKERNYRSIVTNAAMGIVNKCAKSSEDTLRCYELQFHGTKCFFSDIFDSPRWSSLHMHKKGCDFSSFSFTTAFKQTHKKLRRWKKVENSLNRVLGITILDGMTTCARKINNEKKHKENERERWPGYGVVYNKRTFPTFLCEKSMENSRLELYGTKSLSRLESLPLTLNRLRQNPHHHRWGSSPDFPGIFHIDELLKLLKK